MAEQPPSQSSHPKRDGTSRRGSESRGWVRFRQGGTGSINRPLNVGNSTRRVPSAGEKGATPQQQRVKVSLIAPQRVSIKPSNHSVTTVLSKCPNTFYDMKNNEWHFDIQSYDVVSSELAKLNVVFESIPKGTLSMVTKSIAHGEYELRGDEIYETLMKFQKDAVTFAINRGGRVLLADDMGLGKTIQALAIAHYYRVDYPLLIIAQASLLEDWKSSITRFLPDSPNVIRSREQIGSQVSIISYNQATAFADEIKQLKPGIVICDECHSLKSMTAKRTKSLLPILQSATRLIMISGTPALSRPLELYPIFMALDKMLFPYFGVYGTRYCNGKKVGHFFDYRGCSNANELSIALEHAFMIRRTKECVLKELPAKFRRRVLLTPAIGNSDVFNDNKMVGTITGENTLQESSVMTEFAKAAKLKKDVVLEYLGNILGRGIKTVIFAHHQEMLNEIEEYCKNKEVGYIRIDGTTPVNKRYPLVVDFQKDEGIRVAILSITSCSSGITLTAGKAVLFAELYWNPGTLLQAEDRIHRIGQKDCVDIHYLVAKNTVDEFVWPHILKKLNVLESLGIGKNELKYVKGTESGESVQKRLDDYVIRDVRHIQK